MELAGGARRSFVCHSLAHYSFARRAATPHATALRALKFEILISLLDFALWNFKARKIPRVLKFKILIHAEEFCTAKFKILKLKSAP